MLFFPFFTISGVQQIKMSSTIALVMITLNGYDEFPIRTNKNRPFSGLQYIHLHRGMQVRAVLLETVLTYFHSRGLHLNQNTD